MFPGLNPLQIGSDCNQKVRAMSEGVDTSQSPSNRV